MDKYISVKKFWTYIILGCFVMLSLCVYGSSVKTAAPIKNFPQKYEVKSDILNFDYTKMAYPSQESVIGIKTNSGIKLPEKRKLPRQLTDEEIAQQQIDEVISGLKTVMLFIFIFIETLGLTAMTPSLFAFFLLWLRRVYISNKSDNTEEEEKIKVAADTLNIPLDR